MRKIVALVLLISICIGISACEQKAPPGVDQKFYNEIIRTLPTLEKALKEKNTNYCERVWSYASKFKKEDLNDQEAKLYDMTWDIGSLCKMYISVYQNSKSKYDNTKLIDVNQPYGDELVKGLQKYIDELGIKYQLKI